MYISLHDFVAFLAVALALITGGFFLLTLVNLHRLAVRLNKLITENNQHVQEIVENLKVSTDNLSLLTGTLRKNLQLFEDKIPGAVDNFYALSERLKDAGEKADNSLEILQTSFAETAATVTESTKDLLAYLKIASQGIKVLIRMFIRK